MVAETGSAKGVVRLRGALYTPGTEPETTRFQLPARTIGADTPPQNKTRPLPLSSPDEEQVGREGGLSHQPWGPPGGRRCPLGRNKEKRLKEV